MNHINELRCAELLMFSNLLLSTFMLLTGTWVKSDTPKSSKSRSLGRGCSEEYSPCGTYVVLVKDNGVGVAPENLKFVFADGWQFKANILQVMMMIGAGCIGLLPCSSTSCNVP